MAEAIAEGARSCGAEVSLTDVTSADDGIPDGDVTLFGCPAMGAEQLEESEFEPFFSSPEGRLSGKKIGLFGAYDWDDGEWIRLWTEWGADGRCGSDCRRVDGAQCTGRESAGRLPRAGTDGRSPVRKGKPKRILHTKRQNPASSRDGILLYAIVLLSAEAVEREN